MPLSQNSSKANPSPTGRTKTVRITLVPQPQTNITSPQVVQTSSPKSILNSSTPSSVSTFDHTSASTFDPDATMSPGPGYYAFALPSPMVMDNRNPAAFSDAADGGATPSKSPDGNVSAGRGGPDGSDNSGIESGGGVGGSGSADDQPAIYEADDGASEADYSLPAHTVTGDLSLPASHTMTTRSKNSGKRSNGEEDQSPADVPTLAVFLKQKLQEKQSHFIDQWKVAPFHASNFLFALAAAPPRPIRSKRRQPYSAAFWRMGERECGSSHSVPPSHRQPRRSDPEGGGNY